MYSSLPMTIADILLTIHWEVWKIFWTPINFSVSIGSLLFTINAISEMFAYSKSRVKVELKPESDMEAIVSIEKTRRFKEWLNR